MMVKKYLTQYVVDEQCYSFFVIAKDEATAKKIITARGLNEEIIGSAELNDDLIDFSRNIDLLHLVIFLGYVAIKSNQLSVDEVLSDRGVIHEIIHCLGGDADERAYSEINDKIKYLFDLASISVSSRVIDAIRP